MAYVTIKDLDRSLSKIRRSRKKLTTAKTKCSIRPCAKNRQGKIKPYPWDSKSPPISLSNGAQRVRRDLFLRPPAGQQIPTKETLAERRRLFENLGQHTRKIDPGPALCLSPSLTTSPLGMLIEAIDSCVGIKPPAPTPQKGRVEGRVG